jgi:HemY protein
MRWLFWTVIILGLTIGIALLASGNTGYVLIKTPTYRLETSLNFLIVVMSLSFICLHLALRLFNYTRNLPATVRTYKENLRKKAGHQALIQSLHALVEGRYELAEKTAAKALDLGEDAGLTALIGARAAHKLRHKTRRDYFLSEAERLAPKAAIARLLTQTEMLLDDQQYQLALTILKRLAVIEPHYQPALLMELKIQTRLKNWDRVLTILKTLEKTDLIEVLKIKEIRLQAHQALIKRYAQDVPSLNTYWKKLSEEDQFNERLVLTAVVLMIEAGAHDDAARIVEMNLTKHWSSALVRLLGNCITTSPTKQLQQAEYWLMNHPNDADLLETLGKLCVRLQLWGKAESYYEASLSIEPSATRHLALANLLEQKGQLTAANQHYRASTNFVADLH